MPLGLYPSQGFACIHYGICFQKLGLLRADGSIMLEEGKSIFCHRLARLVRRALNERCQGKGTSVHPCGKMDCRRMDIVLKAISHLRSCSCTNFQRVGTALPLTGTAMSSKDGCHKRTG